MMMCKKNRREGKVFALLLTAVFTVLSSLEVSAQTQKAQSVEELVESISGGKLKVETGAEPSKLVGDFNGDKVEDVAVIVRLAGTIENIAKKVKIEYPYYSGKEVDTGDLALFIIHGKGKGWQFAQKSAVLFLGRSSALIFQKTRMGEHGEKGGNWEIQKHRNGKVNLFFATDGSDGTMKWNGKKYVWTESEP